MRISKILCLVGSLGLATSSAMAATLDNNVVLSNGGGGTPGCSSGSLIDLSGATTQSDFAATSGPGCVVELAGYAGGGVVGILGDLSATPGSRGVMQITARASSAITNLVLEPAVGWTEELLLERYGTEIDLTLNARLEAFLKGTVNTAVVFARGAGAGLDGTVRFFTTGGNRVQSISESVSATNSAPFNNTLDDKLISQGISLTSTHRWQEGLGVTFSLQGRATVSPFGDTAANAEFNALNSLGFVTDAPVFDLPEGFTVNNAALNIVNNRWADPRVSTTPIPLPAGLPLLLAGLSALSLIRRKSI